MSKVNFKVIYDGPGLADHGMDVYALAPALLAFGDLIKEANSQINGNKTKINLIVTPDFEHRCFEINFELLQQVFEEIRSLLGDADIKTAKEILEWLGILGIPTGLGLFSYLRFRRGRKIKSVAEIKDTKSAGMVSIQFEGDDNEVHVHNNVYQLGENPKVRSASSRVIKPLESEGIDALKFEQEGQRPLEVNKAMSLSLLKFAGQASLVDEVMLPS